ncbi:transglycosylase SLT domain-containing protein [Dickeya oryzae]|uniref:Transglycosylase SLT domain-containing protein n=1 Tax=Dickeya oryzae TaxID=1240404 RepID=A0ABS5BJD5_9GAMM|nr:transglycosylase SLT domain-containing protein [Dickeya oryzae]
MANCGVLITLLFSLMMPLTSAATDLVLDIPWAYQQIAQDERVPVESLYSLALAESSKKLAGGRVRPWPWTINVAGTGYRYETREKAMAALLSFIRVYPLKRIDVGIAQVNLGWNGHLFPSLHDAFDPYLNLRVAARLLRACYESSPGGSWIRAAGCYHHPAGGQAARVYMDIVRSKLNRLSVASATSLSQLTWVEPDK